MEGNILRCRSCKKLLLSGSLFCNYCGAEQQPQKKKKKTRRPMNSGTVRKLPGNRAKPYAAYLPRSMGGKYIGSYDTAAKASDALTLEIASRPSSDRIEWTVGDFYEYYINSKHFSELSVGYQGSLKSHWNYCKQIADMPMRKVKTQEWQKCVDTAIELNKSKSTVKGIKDLASALCDEAMRDDVISRNYSELLQLGGAEKKNRDIFTADEIALLKAHDSDIRVKFILILIYTGLRITELLELPVENVHEKYMIGGKKTAAGRNRIVPILPDILPYIEFFKRDEGLLIHRNGKPVTANFAREKWFYAPLVELGILTAEEVKPGNTPRLCPHYSRHTFSTLATEAGVRPDVIKRIIGHTSYKTTDEHYVEMQAEFLYGDLMKMSSQK